MGTGSPQNSRGVVILRADIIDGKLNGSKGSAFTSEKEKITIPTNSKDFHFTGFTSFKSNCDINPGSAQALYHKLPQASCGYLMSGSLPESLDCGFGNAECGLLNSNSVFDLRFIIFNPKPGTRPKGGSPKDKSKIINH
jgi:hypothetical protein